MGFSALLAGGLEALGVGTTTAGIIGTAAATGLEGAAIGAGTAALTGGKPLKGAEIGGLAGIGAGLGPAIGSGLGIGATAGGALGGAAGGALGGLATGTNPLTGAITGGVGGAIAPNVGNLFGSSGGGGGGGGGGATADQIASEIPGGNYGGMATQAQIDSQIPGGTLAQTATPGSPETLPSGGGSSKGGLFGSDFTLRDALATGGLGLTAMRPSNLPGEKQIAATAGQLGTQGQSLASYLQTGQLPSGVASGIHQASEAAKATLRSRFAEMGMSNSTSEAQAVGNVDMMAETQGAQIAMNLLNSGIQESQLSAELYNLILQNSIQQDNQLGSAISNFATAMAGGNPQQKAA